MAKPPVSATLFAYQVGFGDAFLLRFTYEDGRRRHVLIDFGTTSLPKHVPADHMVRVARDISARCTEGGNRLDVVVATHRHADHVSGFATRADGSGSGDVIRALKPRVVIQPWTEAEEAPLDWLGPEKSDPAQAFARRRRSLEAMHEAAGQALEFVNTPGRRMAGAVAAQLAFIGEDNLSNASAVRNLMTMGGRREYVFHGADPKLGRVLPGLKVHVLGPPTLRQTETIRKQRSRDEDEFWQLAPKRLAEATASRAAGGLFPAADTFSKLPTEHRWLARRLDEANAELMLGLVRALDKQMNNTSVILLFKAGSKSLLFPGDAQWENWAYALNSSLAPLLDDVDLYKVGHHGSLNATPHSMWRRFGKRGTAGRPGRMTSVLSTKHGKHGSEAKRTEVPRRTLLDALEDQTNLHNTEKLPDDALCKAIEIDLR